MHSQRSRKYRRVRFNLPYEEEEENHSAVGEFFPPQVAVPQVSVSEPQRHPRRMRLLPPPSREAEIAVARTLAGIKAQESGASRVQLQQATRDSSVCFDLPDDREATVLGNYCPSRITVSANPVKKRRRHILKPRRLQCPPSREAELAAARTLAGINMQESVASRIHSQQQALRERRVRFDLPYESAVISEYCPPPVAASSDTVDELHWHLPKPRLLPPPSPKETVMAAARILAEIQAQDCGFPVEVSASENKSEDAGEEDVVTSQAKDDVHRMT